MKRLTTWTAIILMVGACSTTDTTTTRSPSTVASAASTTIATTITPTTSTTQPPPPEFSLIVSDSDGIDLLSNGEVVELKGDADIGIVAAFDDLAGGLIYQYEITPDQFPPNSVLRIRAGSSAPEVVLSADADETITLLDVETIDGRTNLLYLSGPAGSDPDALMIADVAGGAPTVVARVDPAAAPGESGVVPTSILGGALSDTSVAVVWRYGDIEAACNYVEVFDFEGTITYGPEPALCGEQDWQFVSLSADGSRLALAAPGLTRAVDVESGEALASWDTLAVRGLDFDGSNLIVLGEDRYRVLSLESDAPSVFSVSPTTSQISAARQPVELAEGTFLGGIASLATACSASGMAQIPEPQGGLPEPVAQMREAIVAAATACDIEALTSLITPGGFTYSFGSGSEPGRFWRQGEQDGYGPLARIVDVLDLPFIFEESEEGLLYMWPSAFQAEPTEADWEALSAVYNEEDIDLFRDFGGYIGMRVGITEDGTWIFAVEGD